MALTFHPPYVQTPNVGVIAYAHADTAPTVKTLLTAGANGTKVVAIWAATNDNAVTNILNLVIHRSGSDYTICAFTIPQNAGTDGTLPHVNMLAPTSCPGLPLDSDGQPYLLLKSGDSLVLSNDSTPTAAKFIQITGIGADF